jgi:hypothetical protein
MNIDQFVKTAREEKERRDSDLKYQICELAYLSIIQMCESESIFMEPSEEKKSVNKIFSNCKTMSEKMIKVRESIIKLNFDYVGNFRVNDLLNSGICLLNIVLGIEEYSDFDVSCALLNSLYKSYEPIDVPPYV